MQKYIYTAIRRYLRQVGTKKCRKFSECIVYAMQNV